MTRNKGTETHIAERCAQEVCSVIFNELSARGLFKDADAFSAALDKAMEDIRPLVADFIAEAGGGRAAAEPEAKPIPTCGVCGAVEGMCACDKAEQEAKRPPRVSDEEHERRKPLPPHVLLSGRDPVEAEAKVVRGLAPWDSPCRASLTGDTCCFATSGGKSECTNCGRLG